jgi:hypothetical protein
VSVTTYELCINADIPGDGVLYETLERAMIAGEAAITPVEREDVPMVIDPYEFFTVHEGDGAGTALKYDSRWSE